MPLKLLNWNVEWAEPKWKAAELQRRIGQHAADIVCLTETDHRAFDVDRRPLHLRPGQLGATLQKGPGGQTEGPAVVQRVLEGRGCCWPRIATARAICVRRHPDRRW